MAVTRVDQIDRQELCLEWPAAVPGGRPFVSLNLAWSGFAAGVALLASNDTSGYPTVSHTRRGGSSCGCEQSMMRCGLAR